MIETYKILNGKYDDDVSNFIPLRENQILGATTIRYTIGDHD